jgi:predicted PurR-regulated permease PerM
VLLLALAYAARSILVQLTVAIVLAMALEPLVQALEHRGLRRSRAVGAAYTAVLLALAAFAYLLIPPLVDEIRAFVDHIPSLLKSLTEEHGPLGFLERRFHIVERARTAIAAHGASDVIGTAQPAIAAIGRTFSIGGAVFAVAFLTLFVSLGGRQWFDGFLRIVPAESRDRWQRAGSGVSTAVGGYVAGNLLISVIAGTYSTVTLLVLGVPYAIPLGLVVALFDLIPLVGATLATIIVALVALTKGVTTMVIVVGLMWLYQQIESHTLTQIVYHRTVKLSPLAITVSVAAGAEVGGIVGALLGIPIAGALKVVFGEIVSWRRHEPVDPTTIVP